MRSYSELHCRSYFSFLAGASSPEDLATRASDLGYHSLAITDVDGVYGAPRAHIATQSGDLRFCVGAEVTIADDLAPPTRDGPPPAHRVVLLPKNSVGYANLCRLITIGRTRCAKGSSWVSWAELSERAESLVCLSGGSGGPIDSAWHRGDLKTALAWAHRLAEVFGDSAHIELTHHLCPGDDERIASLSQLSEQSGLTSVITQDARFATSDRRRIYDVQTAIRAKVPLASAGRLLAHNGEQHLHTIAALYRRFARYTASLERTVEVASSLEFSLEALRYRFPPFDLPSGETPFSFLYRLTQDGARARYQPMTPRAAAQIAHELALIEKLNLAGYFLIVWDIVKFCRERQILCQGRGSAANSAVCYSLGITAVDPVGMELLFERFLSEERDEMPDIDLDIASDRREEVIQYVYRRFGLERCAMACNIVSYHARSAIRDIGKAFGLSQAQVDRAAKAMDRHMPDLSPQGVPTNDYQGIPPIPAADRNWIRHTGLDPDDPGVAQMFSVARAFEGFPRHLGIHSGGVVIAAGPTWEVVPVENATMEQRTVVQWDKDDLNSLGIVKIDLLGLGMLTAIDKAVAEIRRHQGIDIDLAHLPADDTEVYDMICRADTVGTFQIESRAQMNMLPRLKPRTFYDLVVEVAIIRPGPIQGDMIHPYLRRRNGDEPVVFEHPSLEPVLGRTLGVPLFQEQGMKLAIACAGFTPAEADQLRRAMGHKRSHAKMAAIRDKLLAGMEANGISADLAARLYAQLCAFADYGFPESHSASFALIVYASCYLKHHHPAAFLTGLLNAQPMGFYSPNSLVADARRHDVVVHSPCARLSEWESRLEGESAMPSVRLGLREIRGLGDRYRDTFEIERARAPFASLIDFARRSGFPSAILARMAAADAFASFGTSRRQALWEIAALPPNFGELPLLDREHLLRQELKSERDDHSLTLTPMDKNDELISDFAAMGISVDSHPVALLRGDLYRRGIRSAEDIAKGGKNGERAKFAGMVITRQRPGSAKGMMFMTVEDETGLANLVLTPRVFDRYRQIARGELLILAEGKLEREGLVVNLLVDHLERLSGHSTPTVPSRDFR